MEQLIEQIIDKKIEHLFSEEIKRNDSFRKEINKKMIKMKQDVDGNYAIIKALNRIVDLIYE